MEPWPEEMTRDKLLRILDYRPDQTKKLLRSLQTNQVRNCWSFYLAQYDPTRTQSELNMTSIIERVMVRLIVGAEDFRNVHRGYTSNGGLTLSDLFVSFIVMMISAQISKYNFWVAGKRDPLVYAKRFYAILQYLRYEAARGVDVMALDPSTGEIGLVEIPKIEKTEVIPRVRLEPSMKSILYLR